MTEYLHSSINTRIIDRSFVTQVAQGTTTLYAAMLAEQGPDNEIVTLNDPSEFLFNFGDPNLEKYGQTGYNVLRWLQAGGKAHVIRTLPSTASYSNVILNLNLAAVGPSSSVAASSATISSTVLSVLTNTATWQGIYDGTMTLNINGITVIVTSLDFSGVTNGGDMAVTGPEIAAIINGALNLPGTANDVTVAYATLTGFTLTTTATGAATSLTIGAVTAPDVSFHLGLANQTDTGTDLIPGVGANTSITPSFNNSTLGAAASVAGLQALVGDVVVDNSTVGLGLAVPVMAFYPKGRGSYYNANYGISLAVMSSLDKTFEFRTYELNITAVDGSGNSIVIEGPFVVSFDTLAKSKSRESMYIANVINKYSKYLNVYVNSNNIQQVLDYMDFKNSGVFNPLHIDLVFGKQKKDATVAIHSIGAGYTFQWITTSFSLLTNPYKSKEGLLASGRDVALGVFSTENAALQAQEESILAAAYSGTTVTEILNVKKYLIDVVLDANYSSAVKEAVGAFISARGDCVGMLDVGFQANHTQSINERLSNPGLMMSDFRLSVWAHDFIVRDTYNGLDIKVTTPYMLANKIPTVDNNLGIQYPFVGPTDGVVSGFEKINFIPNEDQKEEMYQAQVNYVEQDPRRYNFGSQLTSQVQNSALSDINNVRALLRIKRETETLMNEYRFKFNDQQTLTAANYDLNESLQRWVTNRACSYIKGTVYRSDYDRQQKIARVKIELQFTGIIERIFIDIIVNR